MPTKNKDNKEKRELIEGFVNLIIEKGLSNISIQDISEKAGFSKDVTMYYYKKKDEVVYDAVDWLLESLLNRIKNHVKESKNAEGMLKSFVDATFIKPEKDREFYILYFDFFELSFREDNIKKIFVAYFKDLKQIACTIAEKGNEEGSFKDISIEDTSFSIVAMVKGLMTQWLFDEVSHIDFNKENANTNTNENKDNQKKSKLTFDKYKNCCYTMLKRLLIKKDNI
jgi:AcrR family transcriptional regulator